MNFIKISDGNPDRSGMKLIMPHWSHDRGREYMTFIKKTSGKLLFLVVIATMLLSLMPAMTANAVVALNTGDYIQFGKYNGNPILWRVVNVDGNGSLLLSERILCLKAFDSAGSYHKDSSRKLWGSNYWKDSNIRQWLNSSESKISWLQNAPSKKNLNNGYNAYAEEKGFLADGNFTIEERKAIKPVTRHVLLSDVDKKKAEGGTESFICEGHIEDIVQNYDSAYYHNVTDKVFFLNIKELKEYLHNRGWEYRACPTEKVVENSIYKDWSLSSFQFWWYWLDTPFVELSNAQRYVNSLGYMLDAPAVSGNGGVRPALYLDLQYVSFKSGSGSESDPYIVAGGLGAVQQNQASDNSDTAIKIQINGKSLITEAAPITVSGRVLVPFRAIFEALGAIVEWNQENLTAMGGKGRTYVCISPDNADAVIMTVKSGFNEKVTFQNLDQAIENNNFITLDVPPTAKNGRIMVPVRFIAESLGAKVVWDGKTRTVMITAP